MSRAGCQDEWHLNFLTSLRNTVVVFLARLGHFAIGIGTAFCDAGFGAVGTVTFGVIGDGLEKRGAPFVDGNVRGDQWQEPENYLER